ncbi:MAG TPA: hypothetical protein VEN99_08665, partial [Acidimicrobiia bacterium]|nr:hypothetical protein [Acidimicrobiia bacterium]
MATTVEQFRAATGEAPTGAETPTLPTAPLLPAGGLGAAALVIDGVAVVLAAHRGLEGSEAVQGVLVAVWTVTGMALVARRPLRPLGVLVSAAALACAGAFAADAAVSAGWRGGGLTVAEGLRCLLAAVVTAAGFHALLALPRGELGVDGR